MVIREDDLTEQEAAEIKRIAHKAANSMEVLLNGHLACYLDVDSPLAYCDVPSSIQHIATLATREAREVVYKARDRLERFGITTFSGRI